MDIVTILVDKIKNWGVDLIQILPNLAVSVLVFLVVLFIAKFIRRMVRKILATTHLRPTVCRLIESAVQFILVFAGVLIALSILQLDKAATSALAGLGLVGLALGYAFQDIISNFVSGIFISINRVIAVGDFIQADGKEGDVINISLRTTTLKSPKGYHIMVPNSHIFEETMTNYTIAGQRRVDITCGVAYDSDLDRVEKITREIIETLPARDTNQRVLFGYTEFGDSSINFFVNFWIDHVDAQHYFGAQSDAIKAIKARFDAEGFDIPFPIRTLIQK